MLGHPTTDPHRDPIPDSKGSLETHDYQTLLNCPTDTPLVLTRVSDQDSHFLRFLDQTQLKPGIELKVINRNNASDQIILRTKDKKSITIGMRAGEKLQVGIKTF